ncbi:hypothetical protein SEA_MIDNIGHTRAIN_39 [Arthrobacter phage MidnightRain]|nr:hypothetical protein SEA_MIDNIGHTRAIN_39 [Arthrobacter phage MidnightRain]
MDWAGFLQWITNQGLALIVAGLAAWVSYKAIRVTRSYQDPVFVLECEPIYVEQHPGSDPEQDLQMVLVNKGNSFAKKVRLTANYDPFGIRSHPQKWELIEGGGGRVAFLSGFKVSSRGFPILGDLVERDDEAAFFTVKFVSQSGHKLTQQVRIPSPYSHVRHTIPAR